MRKNENASLSFKKLVSEKQCRFTQNVQGIDYRQANELPFN